MSIPSSARAVVLQNHVSRELDLSSSPSATFVVKDIPLPSPIPEDSLLVQTLYLSNDPAQRMWMQKRFETGRSDMSALPLGQPFSSFSISRVVQVGGKEGPAKVGDIVEARTQWSDYAIIKKEEVKVRKELPGVSLSAYLGALGISGGTAYAALVAVLKPKVTDTLVVSGAAGAVGNVAVQYAKNVLGVKRVVAIAGTDEKCAWLKSIGADEAVNYKSTTFVEDLTKATPDKVDLFFDNVCGSIMNKVMARMNSCGIICAVGAISTYNLMDKSVTIDDYTQLIVNRLSLVGFTFFDFPELIAESKEKLASAITEGKLTLEGAETVVDIHGRFEEIPRIWSGLFSGANTGKLITKVAE